MSTPPNNCFLKIPPYWACTTPMAKGRWIGRRVLEVLSTEFRDRSMEYNEYKIRSGLITLNGQRIGTETIFRAGDRLEVYMHRHETPVTSAPVRILHHDKERQFIVVDKPGSLPVHPTGRYSRNTLTSILTDDFGYSPIHTINRLDKLTSGIMIISLNPDLASTLADELRAKNRDQGGVKKEYIARCRGLFSSGEITCEEPLATVNRQSGLVIVHPEGKPAKTVFARQHYDPSTNTSVLLCRPFTGRSHQIRVHLQYLGFPIANDTLYCDPRVWGPSLGKGGVVDASPSSNERLDEFSGTTEDAERIRLWSPFSLSDDLVGVIWRTHRVMDEVKGWSRQRDYIFRDKPLIDPGTLDLPPLPPHPHNIQKRKSTSAGQPPERLSNTSPDAVSPASDTIPTVYAETHPHPRWGDDPGPYCPECYLPLYADPRPERLFIYLHALRYITSLGTFETDMPWWAAEDWQPERA
ncbi:pseudouridine synthase [Punctularia strigosozonata HHB-11173 SS5]|uniref:Pseudouridine synthase n=1 Tax=Punctularia strigosozonata (strain HHB-11173) TaxID=741275 RepID=R7S2Y5_PUNST|nr:pseudouridine synthase [Punctularia strigosozonata HHB-11173 SS5]EIN04209.1 pseudouridine synthase [Punctularia strigosozonata HHB-11173 SS5]